MELIELHCHLDASVRPRTIAELALQNDVQPWAAERELGVVPDSCASLTEYMAHVARVVPLLQTPEALHRVTTELVEDFAAEGVSRGEVRFAPQLHVRRGMDLHTVVGAVADGLRAANDVHDVDVGLLLCCLRHENPNIGWSLLECVEGEQLVVGLDLAGDEARFNAERYADVFQAARSAGVRITVHAGEAAGPDSVFAALDILGAERIGHGVRSVESEVLVARLASEGIPLEMCPTSNVLTRAAVSMNRHPAGQLMSSGVRVTINTDGRTTAATTLQQEFRHVSKSAKWPEDGKVQATTNAAASCFVRTSRDLDKEA